MSTKKMNDKVTKKDETEFAIYERPDPFKFIVPESCPFALRLVSKKRLDNMGGVDPRGYVPITREEFNQHGIKLTNYRGEFFVGAKGNHIEIGDLILCKMPKEMAEQRKAYFQGKADKRAKLVKPTFKSQAERAGMETFGDVKSQRGVPLSDDSDD